MLCEGCERRCDAVGACCNHCPHAGMAAWCGRGGAHVASAAHVGAAGPPPQPRAIEAGRQTQHAPMRATPGDRSPQGRCHRAPLCRAAAPRRTAALTEAAQRPPRASQHRRFHRNPAQTRPKGGRLHEGSSTPRRGHSPNPSRRRRPAGGAISAAAAAAAAAAERVAVAAGDQCCAGQGSRASTRAHVRLRTGIRRHAPPRRTM